MEYGPITITRNDVSRSYGYDLVCSGYLVEAQRVLLVRHSAFGRWVPPGGHLEPEETFAQAACREFEEETGLPVVAISNGGCLFNDSNATTEPLPFHVDVLTEGFIRPTLTQYFFVKRANDELLDVHPQDGEVTGVEWFSREQLDELTTFEQVRFLARFALDHHPSSSQLSESIQ